MANTARDVMNIAAKEIGYCRFDDPQTGTKYGRWYAGIVNDKGYAANGVAFCAMFVSWCMAQAGAKSAVTPEAYCPYMVNKAKAAKVTVPVKQAQYGDIVLFDWGGDGVSDHVGFVEANNGSYLTCIEGNTTGADGRSGSVARRTRAYSTVICVVRPAYTNDSPQPPTKTLRHDIQVWDYNGSNAQRWFCRDNGDGTYSFRNASNWLWLSDPNSSTTQTEAQLWGGNVVNGKDLDDPRPPQKMILEEVGSGVFGKLYNIHPQVAPNLSLDVSGASDKSGVKVQWYPTNKTVAQEWVLIFKNGAYYIQNPAGMKCLDAPNGGYWS